MKYIAYNVHCPRDPDRIYPMTIQLYDMPDGSQLASPCNGCDNCSGHELCDLCMLTLFKLSRKDPTMQSYPQPINPLNYV